MASVSSYSINLPSIASIRDAVRRARTLGFEVVFTNGATPSGFTRGNPPGSRIPDWNGFTSAYRSGRVPVDRDVTFYDMGSGGSTAIVGGSGGGNATAGDEADDHGGANFWGVLSNITGAFTSAATPEPAPQQSTAETLFVPTTGKIPWGLVGIGFLGLGVLLYLRKK